MTVQLPALRERTDLMALTHQLLDKYSNSTPLSIAPDLMLAFQKYSWPGNLRQYNNLLRTCCAMLELNETEINWQHLPDDMLGLLKPNHPEDELNYLYQQNLLSPQAESSTTLANLSLNAMQKAIQTAQGNLSEAARSLGISRQTLYRKLALATKNPP